MLFAKDFILKSRLVTSHALDHQLFILFAEAFGSHGRVWQPPQHEKTPEDRENAIGDKNGLPGFERSLVTDEREAIC